MGTPPGRTADCPTITIGWRKGVLAHKVRSGVMVVARNCELCRKVISQL
jgi:hypothetical protein